MGDSWSGGLEMKGRVHASRRAASEPSTPMLTFLLSIISAYAISYLYSTVNHHYTCHILTLFYCNLAVAQMLDQS